LKKSSEIFEGRWDCSDCGQTRISGSDPVCPRCKYPQDSVLTPSEQWYLPHDANIVTDGVQLEKFNAGAAWNCGRCQTLNYGNSKNCSSCGRPLDFDDTVNRTITYDGSSSHFDTLPDPRDEIIESDLDKAIRTIKGKASEPRVMKDLVLPGTAPDTGRDTKFYEEIRAQSQREHETRVRLSKLPRLLQALHTPHGKKLLLLAAIVLAIVLAFVGFQVVRYYTATVEGVVTATERHWQRSVEVEQYRTLTDSGWDYPGDARVASSERRIRDYRTVIDSYRTELYTDYETKYRAGSENYVCGSKTVDNGNGSFRVETKTCTRSVQVPYQEPVQKSRQVPVTHQEPIYDDWYVYLYDRWQTERWVSVSDATSSEVAWPEKFALRRNDGSIGSERIGDERRETYEVVYLDANQNRHSENIRQEVWVRVQVGEVIAARYFQRNGQLSSVDWSSVSD